MRSCSKLTLSLIVSVFLALKLYSAQTNTVFYGPSPCLDFNGAKTGVGTNYSPFADMLFTYFYLETFESGALVTPGVTNSGGEIQNPGIYADSVDGDDGTINGSGSAGHSQHVITNNITFTFSKEVLGDWPTHVAIVWTDVGWRATTPYYGHIVFEAFGPDTNSLGTIGPVAGGDGLDGGQTAEDRFLGVSDSRGISAISITMPDCTDWELDHLQYGREATIIGQATNSIQLAPTNSGVVQVSWPSETNTLYQVLWTSALSGGTNVWRALGSWGLGVDTNLDRNVGGAIAGNGSTNIVADPIAGGAQRFYRVVKLQ